MGGPTSVPPGVPAGTMGASGVPGLVGATSGVTSPGVLYTWALTTANSSTRSLLAALGSSIGGGRRTWGGAKEWGKN